MRFVAGRVGMGALGLRSHISSIICIMLNVLGFEDQGGPLDTSAFERRQEAHPEQIDVAKAFAADQHGGVALNDRANR